jgi:hypothetical protein
MSVQQQLMLTIGIIGAGAMVGVFATFYRRGQGFGPLNLRAMGIVLIGTFAALLAAQGGNGLTAGFGVLGAIAGYIFGFRGPDS